MHRLSQRLGVDMPVTGTMYSVLYEGFAPRELYRRSWEGRLKGRIDGGAEWVRFVFPVDRRMDFFLHFFVINYRVLWRK